jgi:hypothetical protein
MTVASPSTLPVPLLSHELQERFWARIEKQEDCWIWRGHLNSQGYGQFHCRVAGRSGYLAHRLMYRLVHGEVPDGLYVLHRCDVRLCVNPDHLFVGSAADNLRDMVAKGRQSGPRSHCNQGHEFTPENTYSSPSNPRQRTCRICSNARDRAYRAAKRQAKLSRFPTT